jgi:hypothetical protein
LIYTLIDETHAQPPEQNGIGVAASVRGNARPDP